MAYYHCKPINIRAVAKSLMSMDKNELKELLTNVKKLKQVVFGKDIDYLEPHTSTHGEKWVYAAKQEVLSLLFGSSKSHGDFDGIINVNENGKVVFKEAFEGAFKERFNGEKCVLFEVDESNFEEGKTSFSGEVVSSKPAKVTRRKRINNVYAELNAAIERGDFELETYKKGDPDYEAEIEQHISSRIKSYGILDKKDKAEYKFCQKHFPQIMKSLEQEASLSDSGPTI